MNNRVEEALETIREAVAVAGALGNVADISEIGATLVKITEEARATYALARQVPKTPMSGEAIGHAFGDIPLCRGCSMEIGLGHPYCAECAMERAEAAVDALTPLTA